MEYREYSGEPWVIPMLVEAYPRPLSGEEMAQERGVTRKAAWKAVQRVRREGLSVTSSRKGYFLREVPDVLWPGTLDVLLQDSAPWLNVMYHASCASTNTLTKDCARAGEKEGTLVVTEHQHAGRGREERGWFSLPGKSLTFSLLLRPCSPSTESRSLPLLAAHSLAEALEKELGIFPRLKWPNDLLLEEKKVAGLLFESSIRAGMTDWVVLGVGVNVNLSKEDFPDALRDKATSLSLNTGQNIARYRVMRSFLAVFWNNYRDWKKSPGFSRWETTYLSRLAWVGNMVEVRWADNSVKGRLVGVDGEGALVVETAEGNKKYYWGEASLLSADV